jgi:hypothetical protein
MTSQEIDLIFIENINQLNKLNIASASMLKALIQALEANCNVYIRLERAEVGGHSVAFSYVAGDPSMIEKIASALGVAVIGNTLKAKHD